MIAPRFLYLARSNPTRTFILIVVCPTREATSAQQESGKWLGWHRAGVLFSSQSKCASDVGIHALGPAKGKCDAN